MHKEFIENTLSRSIVLEKIVSLFYSDLHPTFASPGESHDFWEFIYVDAGAVEIELRDRTFIMKKGDIYFHPPCEFHCHKSYSKKAPSICIGSFYYFGSYLAPLTGRVQVLSDHCQNILLQILKYSSQMFSSVIDTNEKLLLVKKDRYPQFCEQMVLNYLEIFLLELVNSVPFSDSCERGKITIAQNQRNHREAVIQEARNYLMHHIDSHISIAELCAHLNCSKTMLSVTFKECTGLTIIEYFNKLKIEKAKEIIRTQELNITQISDLLSFCNINYFSNQFKKHTGVYPSDYAKSIKSREHIHLLSKNEKK